MRQLTQFLCILFLINTSIYEAQEFQGVATYEHKISKSTFTIDSTKVKDPVIQQKIKEMVINNFEKSFQLFFNKEVTIFKEKSESDFYEPALDEEEKIRINIVSSNTNNIFYLNLKERTYIEQSSISGKLYLIKNHLEKKDWQLKSDTKTIGEYICYKAIRREKISKTDLSKTNEENTEYRTITAWYTLQIPVSSGPFKHNGLPGLILEVSDGNTTTVCSEITINPEKRMIFEAPNEGEEIELEKFRALKLKRIDKEN